MGVVPLPDAYAVHGDVAALRVLLLLVLGEHGAQQVPVVVGGQRTVRDAQVTGHARLGVERAVVVAGGLLGVGPEPAAQLTGSGDRVGRVVRRVVVRPVGGGQDAGDAGAQRGRGVGGDAQTGDQPGVVDGGEERADRVAGAGPLGEDRTVVRVVPVEPEAVVALQLLDGPHGVFQPAAHGVVADHPEPGGGHGRPEAAADVGGGGLTRLDGGAGPADVDLVDGETEVGRHGLDRAIRVAEPAQEQRGVRVARGLRGGARGGAATAPSDRAAAPVPAAVRNVRRFIRTPRRRATDCGRWADFVRRS